MATLIQSFIRDEKATWEALKLVLKGFLGNRRKRNYEELVENLIKAHTNIGCNMLLKIHFLTKFILFHQTVEQLVMEMVKGFTKIFKLWKRDNKVN